MTFTLADLAARVHDRAGADPETSYTAKLLSGGLNRVAQKFGEEAVEAIVAAVARDKKEFTGEVADVLYHLMVLLEATGTPLDTVMDQLERRTAQSGLVEKASRHGKS